MIGALLLALMFAGAAQADSLDPEHELWRIPTFTLTDKNGQAFSSDALHGKLWVAHFFYTTCTGGCTKTAPTMARLQDLVRGKPGIRLVSVSLNEDKPDILERYAHDLGADADQWLFLTGPKEKVHELVRQSFKLPVEEVTRAQPGQEVVHSFNLMIVDGKGQVRGWVDGQMDNAEELVYGRLRRLDRSRYLLPSINAVLNFQCGVLLVLGYLAIRQRRETLHKVAMLAALAVSMVFLASYLYFHIVVQEGQPTRFRGEGWVRAVYFAILLSHTVLAAVVAPLALYVAYQGLRDRRPRHVRLARWTLPIWLYVSVTGVVVYWMLYHLYPPW